MAGRRKVKPPSGSSRRVRVSEPAPSTWPGDEPVSKHAKLFWNGRSQAVRLPREFRFEGDEVSIRREGERVILEPLRDVRRWPAGYFERLRRMSRYFRDFEVPEPLPPGGAPVDFDGP